MKTYVRNVKGVINKIPVCIQAKEFTKSVISMAWKYRLTLWSSVFSGNKNICVVVMYKHVLSKRCTERERERVFLVCNFPCFICFSLKLINRRAPPSTYKVCIGVCIHIYNYLFKMHLVPDFLHSLQFHIRSNCWRYWWKGPVIDIYFSDQDAQNF